MTQNLTKLAMILTSVLLLFACSGPEKKSEKIDRFSLVNRHNVIINQFDSLSSLSVGNGEFAFTVDATGLQTFPDVYENGVCLGTMSEWGWHSFSNTKQFKLDEAYKYYEVEGRQIPYAIQWNEPGRKKDAANYFRENPHRLHLGNIGLELLNSDKSKVRPNEINKINQQLNLWKGVISSSFEVENEKIEVLTFCHPEKDLIGIEINSERLKTGLVGLKLKFPYPTGLHVDGASDWENSEKHHSEIIQQNQNRAVFKHTIDTTVYFIHLNWEGDADLVKKENHYFVLQPGNQTTSLKINVEFSSKNNFSNATEKENVKLVNTEKWKEFWETGEQLTFQELRIHVLLKLKDG